MTYVHVLSDFDDARKPPYLQKQLDNIDLRQPPPKFQGVLENSQCVTRLTLVTRYGVERYRGDVYSLLCLLSADLVNLMAYKLFNFKRSCRYHRYFKRQLSGCLAKMGPYFFE